MKIAFDRSNLAIQSVLHLSFWLFSVFFFAFLFRISDQVAKIDLMYAILFHVSIVASVYLNLRVLVPYLLEKRKYSLYLSASVLLLVLSSWFNQITFDQLADLIFPDYYFIGQFGFWETFLLLMVYLAGTMAIQLSNSWFALQEAEKRIAMIEKEKLQGQLQGLRSQINPHFLFNSLNLLYAMTLKRSDETPKAILTLSDILRYALYETDQEKVALRKEAELIGNYLELQRHRLNPGTSISFETRIEKEMLVPPMLLLPLVENSFKHGVTGDIRNTYLRIDLKSSSKGLEFIIENNRAEKSSDEMEEEGGIGLQNIQKRLELLYPGKYQFIVKEEKSFFRVTLKIYE